jgi:hypothetical protein
MQMDTQKAMEVARAIVEELSAASVTADQKVDRAHGIMLGWGALGLLGTDPDPRVADIIRMGRSTMGPMGRR